MFLAGRAAGDDSGISLVTFAIDVAFSLANSVAISSGGRFLGAGQATCS
jgi:hypothetical protein